MYNVEIFQHLPGLPNTNKWTKVPTPHLTLEAANGHLDYIKTQSHSLSARITSKGKVIKQYDCDKWS